MHYDLKDIGLEYRCSVPNYYCYFFILLSLNFTVFTVYSLSEMKVKIQKYRLNFDCNKAVY